LLKGIVFGKIQLHNKPTNIRLILYIPTIKTMYHIKSTITGVNKGFRQQNINQQFFCFWIKTIVYRKLKLVTQKNSLQTLDMHIRDKIYNKSPCIKMTKISVWGKKGNLKILEDFKLRKYSVEWKSFKIIAKDTNQELYSTYWFVNV